MTGDALRAQSRGEYVEVLHLADGAILIESYLFGPLHAQQAELCVYLHLEFLILIEANDDHLS